MSQVPPTPPETPQPPAGPGWEGQQPLYAPPPAPRNGMGTTALVLGIVGTVFGFIPLFFWVAWICGVLAIVFGLIGVSRAGRGLATNKVMAWFGSGLGGLALVVGIVQVALLVSVASVFSGNMEGPRLEAFRDEIEELGDDAEAFDDVSISECSVVDGDLVLSTEAVIEITNNTDETQSYLITVSVNDDSGDRVGEINAKSNSLAAGQSVTLSGADASGLADEGAEVGPASCEVADVNRFAS